MHTSDSVQPVGAERAHFSQACLLAMDYDGTTNLTSEEAPGIATVNDAYTEAIDGVLGTAAAQTFIGQGGHQHRTPAEIVLGVNPDMSTWEAAEASQDITRLKLDILIKQIGKELSNGEKWPRPTPGFVKMWEGLHADRQAGAVIDTAILSAGHTEFIAKSFEVHDLQQPDILVTDDILVDFGLGYIPPDLRAKPTPLPLTVAKLLWLGRHGLQAHQSDVIQDINQRIIFVGDDPVKDGGLAESAGVDFVLVEPDTSYCAWAMVRQWTAGARASGAQT